MSISSVRNSLHSSNDLPRTAGTASWPHRGERTSVTAYNAVRRWRLASPEVNHSDVVCRRDATGNYALLEWVAIEGGVDNSSVFKLVTRGLNALSGSALGNSCRNGSAYTCP